MEIDFPVPTRDNQKIELHRVLDIEGKVALSHQTWTIAVSLMTHLIHPEEKLDMVNPEGALQALKCLTSLATRTGTY
jgi:hypothetical protein